MTLLAQWEGERVDTWADRWQVPGVEVHDVLGSTNDRARELAAEGAGAFTVVIGEEQTTGRGRAGARWHSPRGSGLWLSTLLPFAGERAPHVPLLVGLAAVRAAERVCPELEVGLKWPNDIQVGGGKVGGVLCERGDGHLVAGIGVNVRQRPTDFPDELAGRAVSLEAAGGGRVSLSGLAGALVSELKEVCARAHDALAPKLLEELARRDVLRDREVVSQQLGVGVARGIAADGALLLERADGRRVRVVAGSVRIR